MKKYFVTGLLTLLPVTITLLIIIWLFNFLTNPFYGLAEMLILAYKKQLGLSLESNHGLILFLSRLLTLIFLLILIPVLGFIGQKFLMSFLLRTADKIFSKIPFVRTVYRLSNELTKSLLTQTSKTFRETVLIPFPHEDALAIGFITGDTPPLLREKTHADIAVFVPTSPHPMSGFVLLSPKKLVRPIDVSVEDAFKFLISCGSTLPPSPSEPKPPS